MLCKWRHFKWEKLSVLVIYQTESKRNSAAFTSKTSSSRNLNLLDITHKAVAKLNRDHYSNADFVCPFMTLCVWLFFFFLLSEEIHNSEFTKQTSNRMISADCERHPLKSFENVCANISSRQEYLLAGESTVDVFTRLFLSGAVWREIKLSGFHKSLKRLKSRTLPSNCVPNNGQFVLYEITIY